MGIRIALDEKLEMGFVNSFFVLHSVIFNVSIIVMYFAGREYSFNLYFSLSEGNQ